MVKLGWPFRQDKLSSGEYVCILASMRTGSNLLQSYINASKGAICLGELFNPSFVGVNRPDVGSQSFAGYSRNDIEERNRSKGDFFDRIYEYACPDILVFRMFDGHDRAALDKILKNGGCKKIILTRDMLQSYVSLEIARETKQWLLKDVGRRKRAKISFDPVSFQKYERRLTAYYNYIDKSVAASKSHSLSIDYSDLNNLPVINNLLSYIKPGLSLDSLPEKLIRQNPVGLKDKVVNFEEMIEYMATRALS